MKKTTLRDHIIRMDKIGAQAGLTTNEKLILLVQEALKEYENDYRRDLKKKNSLKRK